MPEREDTAHRGSLRSRISDRIIQIAFYLAVAGISGVGFLAYHLLGLTQESEAWIVRTAAAISRLEALHRTLVEAESAGRAYLVTGDAGFRESFNRTLDAIDRELHEFRELIARNKTQQALAADLEQQIGSRFAHLEGQIGRRAAGGIAALEGITIGAGAAQMERISAEIGAMKEFENHLLSQRIAERKRLNAYLQLGLAVLMMLGIVLMGAIFRYMERLWLQRREAEQQARHLAQHDTLTGLPNRRLLSDRIGVGLAQAKRRVELLAVLCLDLDGFKTVNDVHGHDAGDALLRLVAERLRDAVRAGDTVARTGGDEFVLALPGLKATGDAETVASKIIERVSAPYLLEASPVSIGTSIGIAYHPAHGTTEGELLKHADEALYEAKRKGKLRYEIAKS